MRASIAVLLLVLAPGANAQAPAPGPAPAPATPASATPALGTLFNTPEERLRLERLRRGENAAERAPGAPAPRNTKPELTGFVKRSDGRHTVWIDGIAVPVADPKAAPALDPRAVRSYSGRGDENLRVERRPPG